MKSKEIGVENRLSREVILEIQLDGTIIDITSNCFRVLGYRKEEMMKHNIDEYRIKKDFKMFINQMPEKNIELGLINKSGTITYMDTIWNSLFDRNKGKDRLYISMIDITKYKIIEEREKMLENIVRNSKDIVYRLEVSPEIRFSYLSGTIEEILGRSIEEHYENPLIPLEISHPDDYDVFIKKITGKADYSKPIVSRYMDKNNNYIWFEDFVKPIYDEEDNFIAIEGICRNIQDRKELEEKLERLSYYDGLTGIYNKRYFQKEINKLNNDIDVKLGIIICDLDNLKYVNDTFGHAEGDIVLKQTSLLLSKPLNEEALIARIGGDEFVIILKDLNEDEFKNIYNKINKSIQDFNDNNSRIPIQISIGVAYNERSIGIASELFKMADKNMYLNKNNKKKHRKSR